MHRPGERERPGDAMTGAARGLEGHDTLRVLDLSRCTGPENAKGRGTR